MTYVNEFVTVRHFGVGNRPICVKCNSAMHVIRRAPHPLHGNSYELQTFACGRCGGEIKRSADAIGLPHRDDVVIAERIG